VLDTTPVATAITRVIGTTTTEQALLTAITQLFPNLTPAVLSQPLQVATGARRGGSCVRTEKFRVRKRRWISKKAIL
jgi:hypothetical protein